MLKVTMPDESKYRFPEGAYYAWMKARELFPPFYRLTIIGHAPEGSEVVIIADADDNCRSIDAAAKLIAELPDRRADSELARWQRFASYCRSCALSGEHDPHTFDQFLAYEAQAKADE